MIVVIADYPVRDVGGISGHVIHPAVDQALEVGRAGLVVQIRHEHEVEGHGRAGLVEQYGEIKVGIGLGQDHLRVGGPRVVVHQLPPAGEDLVSLGKVLRVDMVQRVVVIARQSRDVPTGLVQETRVLIHVVDGVDAEALHAAIHPEAQHVPHLALQRGAAIVEIRLAGGELMQVILLPDRVPFPGGALEDAQPVVRWLSAAVHRSRVAPDVVLVVGLDPLHALLEPLVLVGAMIRHEIENYLQPERPRLRYEPIEIGQSAVIPVDVGEVGDVVAKVHLRTAEDR